MGRKLLNRAIKVNPEFYDAYLGIGIFDYFADTLPGVLKVPALLFISGDKARGIAEVRLALEKGRFFSTEARLFLVEILTRHEKNFKAALEEVAALKASDPSNLFFRLGEILTLIHAQDWQGVLDECDKFLADHKKTLSPGITQQLSLIYLSAGDAYLALGKPREAAAWFTGGIAKLFSERLDHLLLSQARPGMDLMGKREEALPGLRHRPGRDISGTRKYAKSSVKKPRSQEVYRQLMED